MTDNKVPLNRSAGRQVWERSGLDYTVLTPENLRRLISLLDAEMKASGLIRGSYAMRRKLGLRRVDGAPLHACLRCKSFYFDDREAVTFNDDGFIGFAGWADDENIVPVLAGFSKWVAELAQPAAALRARAA